MGFKAYREEDVQAIASAIRQKTGTTSRYTIDQMAGAIMDISGGGDSEFIERFVQGSGTYYINNDNISVVKSNCFYRDQNIVAFSANNCKTIGSVAFSSCVNLQAVNIPNCTSIYNSAFYGCTQLEAVNVDSCKSIYDNAFYSCCSLSSIYAPSATYVGSGAFTVCTSLKNAFIPLVSSLCSSVFSGCRSLENVYITSSNIKTVGTNAFHNCVNLQMDVNFENCTTIVNAAFMYCSKIQNVSIRSCTRISSNAFNQCKSLKTVVAQSASYLGQSCFANCDNLSNVIVPMCSSFGVSSIFANCYNLQEMYMPNISGAIWAGVFANCYSLSHIYVENYLSSIGQSAFSTCSSLTFLNIIYNGPTIISWYSNIFNPSSPIMNSGSGYMFVNSNHYSYYTTHQSMPIPLDNIISIDPTYSGEDDDYSNLIRNTSFSTGYMRPWNYQSGIITGHNIYVDVDSIDNDHHGRTLAVKRARPTNTATTPTYIAGLKTIPGVFPNPSQTIERVFQFDFYCNKDLKIDDMYIQANIDPNGEYGIYTNVANQYVTSSVRFIDGVKINDESSNMVFEAGTWHRFICVYEQQWSISQSQLQSAGLQSMKPFLSQLSLFVKNIKSGSDVDINIYHPILINNNEIESPDSVSWDDVQCDWCQTRVEGTINSYMFPPN